MFSVILFSRLRMVSSVFFLAIFLVSINHLLQMSQAAALDEAVTSTIENDGTILTELRLLKATNARQQDAIAMLEDKVKDHEERVIHLEGIQTSNSKGNLEIQPNNDDVVMNHLREKRPARLLPMGLFRKREKVNDSSKTRMPSSCVELNDDGHTLNAFYIVRDNQLNSNKLQTIYCDFKNLASPNTAADSVGVTEKRLGFLDIKSSATGVYFYVQRNSSLGTKGPLVLRYTLQLLNVGGGMNRSTGVFTAPKHGVYHFDFVGMKFDMLALGIYLRVNGVKTAKTFGGIGPVIVPVAIHSTLKLKSGDRVDIFIENGALTNCAEACIHFTGWLLEEDMVPI